jgi:hypothetical protein
VKLDNPGLDRPDLIGEPSNRGACLAIFSWKTFLVGNGAGPLKHIEIVFQIEEEFEVQFDEEEIAQLVDIESILSALDRVRGR